MKRRIPVKALACVTIFTMVSMMWGQPATLPAATTATAEQAARDIKLIRQDLKTSGEALSKIMPPLDTLSDEKVRQATASEVLPHLKKMYDLIEEFKAAIRQRTGRTVNIGDTYYFLMMRSLFFDADATATLERLAKSNGKEEALDGQSHLLLKDWILADKNAEKQTALLNSFEKLAKENPTNDNLTQTIESLSMILPSSPALAKRAEQIALRMNTPSAKMKQMQLEIQKKQEARVGKPLDFQGRTLDGKNFDSKSLAGKVILVDFWATWCPPCVAEVPNMIEIYKKYHTLGLEIVGVSSDETITDLRDFLKEHPDMIWPQLFDPTSPNGHPVAEKLDVYSYPTLFLIDRKGVLRSVHARQEMEELIPKLLAEQQ